MRSSSALGTLQARDLQKPKGRAGKRLPCKTKLSILPQHRPALPLRLGYCSEVSTLNNMCRTTCKDQQKKTRSRVTEMLTPSEIENLRQTAKERIDFGHKAFKNHKVDLD